MNRAQALLVSLLVLVGHAVHAQDTYRAVAVSPSGAAPTRNELGGFSIMQGESKEALAE